VQKLTDWIDLSPEHVAVSQRTLRGTNLYFPARVEEVSTWQNLIRVVQDESRRQPHQP
jgi:hypothetical protein